MQRELIKPYLTKINGYFGDKSKGVPITFLKNRLKLLRMFKKELLLKSFNLIGRVVRGGYHRTVPSLRYFYQLLNQSTSEASYDFDLNFALECKKITSCENSVRMVPGGREVRLVYGYYF